MTNGSYETSPLTYDASHFLRPCLLFIFISLSLLKYSFRIQALFIRLLPVYADFSILLHFVV